MNWVGKVLPQQSLSSIDDKQSIASQPTTSLQQAKLPTCPVERLLSSTPVSTLKHCNHPSIHFHSASLPSSTLSTKQACKHHHPTPHITQLSTEPIKRPPLPLKRIHDIQTRHRLPLRVLRVRDRVADDAFEERLEHAARLLVDHCKVQLRQQPEV